MIRFKFILLSFVIVSAILAITYLSFTRNKPQIAGRIEVRNGLIYKSSNQKLFTGTYIDTVGGRIVEYDVINGVKNGRFGIYQKNGTPQIVGHFKNNQNDGQWKYYFPDGSLESSGIFINDKVTDKWVWFYPNGKLREEGFYMNGIREGGWVKYDPDGNVISRISFRKDVIVNEQKVEKFSSI